MNPTTAYTGFLFAAATALVLLYVLLPLTRRGGRSRALPGLTESPAGARLREIEEQRALTIEALRDLEFESRLGNLTDEDYLRLKERYTRRAVALLQQAEAAEKSLDDTIEQAVRALRGAVPLRGRRAVRDERPVCDACGRTVGADDRFCPGCGRPVAASQPLVYRNGHLHRAVTAPPAPAPTDRGGPAPEPQPVRKGGVPRWVLASGAVAAVFAAAVAGVYFALAPTAGAPTPVGQVSVNHVHSLLVTAGQPAAIYLSHHDGVERSTDGGRTWATVPGVPAGSDMMGMVSHPGASSTVILSGHNVLLRSSDGGGSFAPLQSDLPDLDIHALAGHPDSPQVLYAYVNERGLFRSGDGGTTWTLVGTQLPPTTAALAVMPVAGRPDMVFAATQGQGVLASFDGGRSWATASGFVNGALPTRQITAVAVDPRSGDSFSSGGMEFTGAVYAGTDAGLFKSTDGGQSWNRLRLETDVAALAVDPADTRSITVANRKGEVFRSPDRGITWRPR